LPQQKRGRFWFVATALGLVLNYILLRRFDPVAAGCTALGLSGCVRRPTGAMPFVWLGLGAAIKLYPIILAPGMLVFAWHQHRNVARSVGQALWGVLALVLPSVVSYAWVGRASIAWLHYHQDRGLHVASSLLSWAILWRGGPGLVLAPEFAYGCTQIATEWGARLAHLSPKLTLLALITTFISMAASLKTAEGLWRTSTALVCALLLTAKVFSPQYMVWLIGMGAMAAASARRLSPILVASLALAALATAQLFPHETRIFMGWRSSQWWLIGRTLALMVLWAHLIGPWRYWRRAFATRRVIDNLSANRHIAWYDK
jgi:uncharacterized membrane protein